MAIGYGQTDEILVRFGQQLNEELAKVAVSVGAGQRQVGKSYFADLRMTFRQKIFLQDWFRNKLRVGLG
jgi:hypothetical protein